MEIEEYARPKTLVEISVACKNLRNRDLTSKSDPQCVLFVRDSGTDHFREHGRTEQIVNCDHPEFADRFSIQFYFEESQRLRFEVYDIDSKAQDLKKHDFLGRVELTLGQLMSAPGSVMHLNLSDTKQGTIILRAEEVSNKEVLTFAFRASKLDKKDFLGKSDPFLMLYRKNEDGTRTLAHRTEWIKKTLEPTWKKFSVPTQFLCYGDHSRPIEIECYDFDGDGGHDLIGTCTLSVAELRDRGATGVPLINDKKKTKKGYKDSGVLFAQMESSVKHTFLDYVRGGTQIHFTVAVDFTASNGNPASAESLHYVHPHQPNQYMVALRAIADVCCDYDSDQMFPALGFGARLPNGEISHEFFLNFHPTDPHCKGVDGVLTAYRKSLLQVQLYGPTNFAPVIYHVAKFASAASSDNQHYFVLLIMTDGCISDVEQTKQAIVQASNYPMSIIIVGVGSEDFDAMHVLDGDGAPLSTADGKAAARDIVQFVPFKKFVDAHQGDHTKQRAALAKEVLAEVPKQMCDYMEMKRMKPRPPPAVQPSNLAPVTLQSIYPSVQL